MSFLASIARDGAADHCRKGQHGGAVLCNGRRRGCLVSAGIRSSPSRCLRDTPEVSNEAVSEMRGSEVAGRHSSHRLGYSCV